MSNETTRSLLPVCDVLPKAREFIKCDSPTAIRILKSKYRSDGGLPAQALARDPRRVPSVASRYQGRTL